MHNTYTEGFLDGMRYSGRLLSDVDDSELQLTYECRKAISQAYMKRDYQKKRSEKFHQFVKNMIDDAKNLQAENDELRRLLTIAQGVDKSNCTTQN